MTLHIKSVGSWTTQLHSLAKVDEVDLDKQTIAFVEGPYGIPSIDFESDCYRIVVLISGGIGVTPNQAICNDLIDAHSKGRQMLKIIFIWIVRDMTIVHAMNESNHFPSNRDDAQHQTHGQSDNIDIIVDEDIVTIQAESTLEKNLSVHNMGSNSLLCTEIYRTSKEIMSEEDLEKQSLSDDAVIIQGRPDFSQIFSRINEFAASRGESRVGVSICGPDAMVIDATKACRELKQDTVKWDTHFEVFNL
jgi:predicted ferric reductase